MAKTLLTQKIESALKVWHPTSYGGYRVDSFRQGFDALEVPVECGSIKSGLVDFVRVQECFTSETKCGTCKLSMYRDEDRDLVMPSVRQYKTKHTYTLDTVITCVEIKVSVSDFHSDHGHNFVGHCNYYAMPLALYKKVKDEIPDGIGVLLYYNGENTCGIRKKIECKPRQLSEKTQKWLIIIAKEYGISKTAIYETFHQENVRAGILQKRGRPRKNTERNALIAKRHREGEKVQALATEYNLSVSTVNTICSRNKNQNITSY